MNLSFLGLLIIQCCHVIPIIAFEEIPSSRHENFTLSETVEHGQFRGVKDRLNLSEEGELQEFKPNHELSHSMKGQKGGHGSSNIVHPPNPKEKSAATKPAFILSATVLSVSLAWGIISFPIL